jgi:hypothetical protein
MKKLIVYAFALSTVAVSLSSCGKYEEGPKFTLLSKKARITNTWKFTKSENNGIDATPDPAYFTLTMSLKNDGTVKAEMTVFGVLTIENGNWEFSSNKEELILSDATGTQALEILKLTNTELKVKQMEGNDVIITTYTAQ